MIGTRTRYSIAQFLELQEPMVSIVLLSKYGVQHLSLSQGQLPYGLLNTVRELDARPLMLVLAEVVATKGDLRARVNPKYRFDERMHDLTQCLLLDGYIVNDTRLVQIDPSIADAGPLEDDLIVALQNSGAPRTQEITAKIGDSAQAFRATPPDYNAGPRECPRRAGDAGGGRCGRRGFARASARDLQPGEMGRGAGVPAHERRSHARSGKGPGGCIRVSESGRPSPCKHPRGSDDPPWPVLRTQHVLVPAEGPSRVQVRQRA